MIRAWWHLVREAWRSARSQPAFSWTTILVIAAGTSLTLATAGRLAATQAQVLARLDTPALRTITVDANRPLPDLDCALVALLARTDVVADVTGLGAVRDVTAAALPGAARVGSRDACGTLDEHAITPLPNPPLPEAWVSPAGASALGLPGAGAIRAVEGPEALITRTLTTPAHLAPYEPLVLTPTAAPATSVRTLVVVARGVHEVPTARALLTRALKDAPRDALTVTTSPDMAELQRTLAGDLTRQANAVLAAVLTGSALITALDVTMLTLARRRDLGRRRALGASRLTIVLLLTLQVLGLAATGAALGTLAATTWAITTHNPTPPPTYTTALALLLTGIAALAAIPPAALAARRDPLAELRVP